MAAKAGADLMLVYMDVTSLVKMRAFGGMARLSSRSLSSKESQKKDAWACVIRSNSL